MRRTTFCPPKEESPSLLFSSLLLLGGLFGPGEKEAADGKGEQKRREEKKQRKKEKKKILWTAPGSGTIHRIDPCTGRVMEGHASSAAAAAAAAVDAGAEGAGGSAEDDHDHDPRCGRQDEDVSSDLLQLRPQYQKRPPADPSPASAASASPLTSLPPSSLVEGQHFGGGTRFDGFATLRSPLSLELVPFAAWPSQASPLKDVEESSSKRFL